jgi:hypothetical protein
MYDRPHTDNCVSKLIGAYIRGLVKLKQGDPVKYALHHPTVRAESQIRMKKSIFLIRRQQHRSHVREKPEGAAPYWWFRNLNWPAMRHVSGHG